MQVVKWPIIDAAAADDDDDDEGLLKVYIVCTEVVEEDDGEEEEQFAKATAVKYGDGELLWVVLLLLLPLLLCGLGE